MASKSNVPPTAADVQDALAVIDSFEYDLEGFIKRYPEPNDFKAAMSTLRGYVDELERKVKLATN